ncbi:MAG: hypothetical protein ACKVOH_05865, partial [Chlamydiales bacterium]
MCIQLQTFTKDHPAITGFTLLLGGAAVMAGVIIIISQLGGYTNHIRGLGVIGLKGGVASASLGSIVIGLMAAPLCMKRRTLSLDEKPLASPEHPAPPYIPPEGAAAAAPQMIAREAQMPVAANIPVAEGAAALDAPPIAREVPELLRMGVEQVLPLVEIDETVSVRVVTFCPDEIIALATLLLQKNRTSVTVYIDLCIPDETEIAILQGRLQRLHREITLCRSVPPVPPDLILAFGREHSLESLQRRMEEAVGLSESYTRTLVCVREGSFVISSRETTLPSLLARCEVGRQKDVYIPNPALVPLDHLVAVLGTLRKQGVRTVFFPQHPLIEQCALLVPSLQFKVVGALGRGCLEQEHGIIGDTRLDFFSRPRVVVAREAPPALKFFGRTVRNLASLFPRDGYLAQFTFQGQELSVSPVIKILRRKVIETAACAIGKRETLTLSFLNYSPPLILQQLFLLYKKGYRKFDISLALCGCSREDLPVFARFFAEITEIDPQFRAEILVEASPNPPEITIGLIGGALDLPLLLTRAWHPNPRFGTLLLAAEEGACVVVTPTRTEVASSPLVRMMPSRFFFGKEVHIFIEEGISCLTSIALLGNMKSQGVGRVCCYIDPRNRAMASTFTALLPSLLLEFPASREGVVPDFIVVSRERLGDENEALQLEKPDSCDDYITYLCQGDRFDQLAIRYEKTPQTTAIVGDHRLTLSRGKERVLIMFPHHRSDEGNWGRESLLQTSTSFAGLYMYCKTNKMLWALLQDSIDRPHLYMREEARGNLFLLAP